MSGDSKNYAYKTFNSVTGAEKTFCKMRGITLNYNASQLVNVEKIKDFILKGNEKETVIIHTERKSNGKEERG